MTTDEMIADLTAQFEGLEAAVAAARAAIGPQTDDGWHGDALDAAVRAGCRAALGAAQVDDMGGCSLCCS